MLARDAGRARLGFRGPRRRRRCTAWTSRARTDYDVAVATWWETVGPALELPARRRYAYFVQSLEDRFYRAGRAGSGWRAALTHDLPLPVITEARWIAETLEALAPERRCLLVRNGIAKDVFALARRRRRCAVDEPLRILIEGNPRGGSRACRRRSRRSRAMQSRRGT